METAGRETEGPDGIGMAVHDRSPRAPRMRTPDLNDGTGGFGWPMVNHFALTTAVTRRVPGGKTVQCPSGPVAPRRLRSPGGGR